MYDYGDFDMDYPGELVLAESNPMAAEAMEIAGELRGEGWDASSALSEGWRQVKGGKSNPKDTFQPSPLLAIIVIAAIAIGIYKWRKGQWPWELLGRPKQIARPVYQRVPPTNTKYADAIVTNVT